MEINRKENKNKRENEKKLSLFLTELLYCATVLYAHFVLSYIHSL